MLVTLFFGIVTMTLHYPQQMDKNVARAARRILVIDDDCAVTELLSVLLFAHGYFVLTSSGGLDGLNLARCYTPDLVILDLLMPGMDGWAVCAAIREFSSMPIIVLSAINEPSMVASVLDAGADHCLTKPVPSYILTAHIRRLLEKTQPQKNGR